MDRSPVTAIRLNKAHFPVTALGPGRRIGLWVQGCSIGCSGCVSRDTWPANGGYEVEIAALLRWCRDRAAREVVDGITISGGEPFDQPVALGALLEELAAWRAALPRPFDILCYSGLPLRTLRARYPDLLARLDAVIPEPYVERRTRGRLWAGSDNQPIVLLTPLARDRYGAWLAEGATPAKRFQVSVTEERIWLIGIPDRGELEAVREACARDGLLLRDVSWRA
jgi:anaerobic ribonucleoside-triphosphate reductase activating protein